MSPGDIYEHLKEKHGPIADAPRPRGKRHSVKPWRDEVRDMIAEDRAELNRDYGALVDRIYELEYPWVYRVLVKLWRKVTA